MGKINWNDFEDCGHKKGSIRCSTCKEHDTKAIRCSCRGILHGISHWYSKKNREIEYCCDTCYKWYFE